MTGLTRKQDNLLRFIERYVVEHRIAPSFTEMQDATGQRSKSGVTRLLVGLEERGRIRRLANQARAIELVHGGTGPDPVITIDVSGRVSVSDRVTPEWLRWNRAAVERALSERFAVIDYPGARFAE